MDTTTHSRRLTAPSRWEWLPVAALALLAAVYWRSPAGSTASRFAFFVGLGLVPGVLWRLTGRSAWHVHRVAFACGLVGFVLDNPDLRPDGATLEQLASRWPWVLLGIGIAFTQPLWGALRTRRLLTDSGIPIGLPATFRLALIGSFFNVFLPGATGGDAYRVYAISRGYATRLAPAIASISLDRFLGLPSLILVVLVGMLVDYRFFLSNRILTGLVPFLAAAGVVCLALVVYLALAGRAGRVPAADGPETGVRGWLRRTNRLIAKNITRPGTLPLALFYGFASHVACILSCQLFGRALAVEGVPFLRYWLIVPMAMAINAIPGAPGGVGQGELAMAKLVDLAGPGHGNAQLGVMIMLLFRLANLAIGLAGGLLYALGGGPTLAEAAGGEGGE
ncbi:MAG: flippase-like domain-containing protein [Planctomycetes bacterium]|nr:flippase-like domain-containing protein [Planctomycetota bacterium]